MFAIINSETENNKMKMNSGRMSTRFTKWFLFLRPLYEIDTCGDRSGCDEGRPLLLDNAVDSGNDNARRDVVDEDFVEITENCVDDDRRDIVRIFVDARRELRRMGSDARTPSGPRAEQNDEQNEEQNEEQNPGVGRVEPSEDMDEARRVNEHALRKARASPRLLVPLLSPSSTSFRFWVRPRWSLRAALFPPSLALAPLEISPRVTALGI